MPVYLRKDEGEPSLQTPSISEFKLKDEDFVLDPEILFDYLPQPYRMIDKVKLAQCLLTKLKYKRKGLLSDKRQNVF